MRDRTEPKNVNGEDVGQAFHAVLDPILAMIDILAAQRILTAKKGASDAPRDAVINADIDFIHDFASSVSWHGITSEIRPFMDA